MIGKSTQVEEYILNRNLALKTTIKNKKSETLMTWDEIVF